VRTISKRMAATAIAATLIPVSAVAQQGQDASDLQEQIDALRQGQKAIQRTLQEIKQLVSQRPTQPAKRPQGVPPNTTLDLAGKPVKGAVNAQLAVIEFLDYQ